MPSKHIEKIEAPERALRLDTVLHLFQVLAVLA